jgi:hypothetical protein
MTLQDMRQNLDAKSRSVKKRQEKGGAVYLVWNVWQLHGPTQLR